MDTLTKAQRSYCMSRIKSKGTTIERKFSKYLFSQGYRGYRLNYKIIGNPDIMLIKPRIAIFIDGCFWHKCPKCYRRPKSNNDYWDKKLALNVKRDKKKRDTLKKQGYRVIKFWEHQIQDDLHQCYLIVDKIYKGKIKSKNIG